MRVTAIANNKGGVCKTTVAAEICAELGRRGARVLALDLEAQGNLSDVLGIPDTEGVRGTMAEVLTGEKITAEAIEASPVVAGVDVLAGYRDLKELSPKLPITRIRDLAGTDWAEWDHVIIDCPPAIERMSQAALLAADSIVVPVRAAKWAVQGLDELKLVLSQQIAPLNPKVHIDWIVPTQIDQRRAYDRDVVALLGEENPDMVTTPVRHSIRAEEAITRSLPVSHYAPRSPVAADYRAAAAQIIG